MKRIFLWIAIALGAFIATLGFAIAMGWTFGSGLADVFHQLIPRDQQQPYGEPDPGGGLGVKWLLDWLPQGIMAVFTLALWVVTSRQKQISKEQQVLLEKANDTAARALDAATESNKQTKRSVDTYVEAERGSLVMRDARLNVDGQTDFALENYGRTGVIILAVWSQTQCVPPQDKPSPWNTGMQFVGNAQYLPLGMGERAATEKMPGPRTCTIPRSISGLVPKEVQAVALGKQRIALLGTVRYVTLTNAIRRYMFMFVSDDGVHWSPVPGDDYQRDLSEPDGHWSAKGLPTGAKT